MENAKVKLGDTEATRIGLGTNRLTNTREHIAFLKEAVAVRVNHIDTAYSYTSGGSEETIGVWELDPPASVADVDAIGERFRPLRTLAAVYLYRSRRRATQPASE